MSKKLLFSLSKNKNFFKLSRIMQYYEKALFQDFNLKFSIKEKSGIAVIYDFQVTDLLEDIYETAQLKINFNSLDIQSLNDINLAKIYFFLNRFYFGIFNRVQSEKFLLKRPKVSIHRGRKESIESKLYNLNFNNFTNDYKNIRLKLAHFLFYLLPFVNYRRLPYRSIFKRQENLMYQKFNLNFSLLDIIPLAAGSASFNLYHDYYDWNKIRLFFSLVNNSEMSLKKKRLIRLILYYFSFELNETIDNLSKNNFIKSKIKNISYFLFLTIFRIGALHNKIKIIV